MFGSVRGVRCARKPNAFAALKGFVTMGVRKIK